MNLSGRILELITKTVLAGTALWTLATARRLHPDPRGIGTHEQLGIEPCGYRITYGRPCITCGMTTSFSHFAHGEPIQSFLASPAGSVIFVITAIAPFWLAHSFFTGRPALRFMANGRGFRIILASAAILLLSWYYKISVESAS